jgi:hypothetical protein
LVVQAPRPRRRIYDEAVGQALVMLYEAADRICGKRLRALLPILIESMERHGLLQLDPLVKTRVLDISAASIDRLRRPVREASARFAREYVAMLRSWTESTFFGALAPNRPLDERRAIIDRYYSAYETLVRENPVGHRHDLVNVYMTIAKAGA